MRHWIGFFLCIMTLASCSHMSAYSDPSMTSLTSDVAEDVLQLNWKKQIRKTSFNENMLELATPTVFANRVYVGSPHGVLYALHAQTGAVVWKKQDIGIISAEILVSQGILFVATSDGYIMSLSLEDGTQNWSYKTTGIVSKSPVHKDGKLFFSTNKDYIYAIDAKQGTFLWHYKAQAQNKYTSYGNSGVVVQDDFLFAGLSDGTLVALRTQNGTSVWITSLKNNNKQFIDVDTPPLIIGDTIYTASITGGAYAIDKKTGAIRWQRQILAVSSVVFDGANLYWAATDAGIYATDKSGNTLWRQGTYRDGDIHELKIVGNNIVIALKKSGLFIANKNTGVIKQYFDPGVGIASSPAIVRDLLFFFSNSGTLYAFTLNL